MVYIKIRGNKLITHKNISCTVKFFFNLNPLKILKNNYNSKKCINYNEHSGT